MPGAHPVTPVIRPVRDGDIEALLRIYAPYVESSAVSFEIDVPSADTFAARVERCRRGWAWLVAELAGEVAGYAYGGPHRDRPAYRWSVETSVYVAADHQRAGIGRALYAALMPILTYAGYCNAYAGITLPNAASVALHEQTGFMQIGVFPAVGHKFGRWHDVAWFHRRLRNDPPTDASTCTSGSES